MKRILFCALFLFPLMTIAQKVKHNDKTNEMTADGVTVFKIERTGCGFAMSDCHFDVYDMEGNKVLRVNYREFKSPVERNASNPEGIVRYYEFIFLKSGKKAEIGHMGMKEEKVAKSIIKNKLFAEGKLDDKAVDEFVLVQGTRYSERVKL
jgi:hypothetical protein